MILLDSRQILEAVQRSLDAHVLPMLEDDFARVQVASAQKALQEVLDRMAEGDPCERMNEALAEGARAIAREHRDTSPELSGRIDAALDAVSRQGEARDVCRALGEALWAIVAGSQDPAARALLALLQEQALAVYSADGRYLCFEAIASLT